MELNRKDITDDILLKVIEQIEKETGFTLKDSQIAGFKALQEGFIEAKTGEGKTLIGLLYAMYYAFKKETVTIVTANPYLAQRDFQSSLPIITPLNIMAILLTPKTTNEEIKKADIVYTDITTLNDWYLNSLNISNEYPLLTKHCLVDELDYVTIDMAQGRNQIAADIDIECKDDLRKAFKRWELSFCKDKCTGVYNKDIVDYLKINNVSIQEWGKNDNHIQEFSKATYDALFKYKKDIDYIVKENKIILINKNTGREVNDELLNYVHQALQVINDVPLTKPRVIINGIASESLLNQYEILTGMSGTLKEEEQFLMDHFNKKLTVFNPDNGDNTIIHKDIIVKSMDEAFERVHRIIIDNFVNKRPIMIVAQDILTSNLLNEFLILKGLRPYLLNGSNDSDEATIMSRAGEPGRITISTQMASRGTDIIVDMSKTPEGLLIIPINHCESARLDRQLIGRTGRQGANGGVQFITVYSDDSEIGGFMNVINGLNTDSNIDKLVDTVIKEAQAQTAKRLVNVRNNKSTYDMLMDRLMIWYHKEKYKKDPSLYEEFNKYWGDVYKDIIDIVKEECIFKDVNGDSIGYFNSKLEEIKKGCVEVLNRP